MNSSSKKLTLTALVAMTIVSVDNVRNLPALALFGQSLPVIFTLAFTMFLLPTAWAISCLSRHFKDRSGVYLWVKEIFGDKAGFYAVWFQWVNNLVWYPVIVPFIISTACFFFAPKLALNPYYITFGTIIVFWTLTLINLKGLQISARLSMLCTIFGLILPLILIIGMGITWLFSHHTNAITFDMHHIMPNWHDKHIWISLTTIMLSSTGMEVATVHAQDVKKPEKNFPKAMFIASTFIYITMMLGGLSIAFILPAKDINLVAGIVQTMSLFLKAYHVQYLLEWIAIMAVLGSLGGVNNWIITPTKGIWQAARSGQISPWLAKTNAHDVPKRLLIIQAIIVTLVTPIYLYLPNINSAYWLLSGGTLELYMLMYLMMFLALLKLLFSGQSRIAKKKITCLLTLFGMCSASITMVVSCIPPDFMHTTFLHYALIMLSLMTGFSVIPLFLFKKK